MNTRYKITTDAKRLFWFGEAAFKVLDTHTGEHSIASYMTEEAAATVCANKNRRETVLEKIRWKRPEETAAA